MYTQSRSPPNPKEKPLRTFVTPASTHSYLVLLNVANFTQQHNAAFRMGLYPLVTEIMQDRELVL